MRKTARKIHRIFVYLMNWICGITFMLSLCMVNFESFWAIAILIGSGLWLAGYCIAHDRAVDRQKGGAKYVRSR